MQQLGPFTPRAPRAGRRDCSGMRALPGWTRGASGVRGTERHHNPPPTPPMAPAAGRGGAGRVRPRTARVLLMCSPPQPSGPPPSVRRRPWHRRPGTRWDRPPRYAAMLVPGGAPAPAATPARPGPAPTCQSSRGGAGRAEAAAGSPETPTTTRSREGLAAPLPAWAETPLPFLPPARTTERRKSRAERPPRGGGAGT